MILFFLTQRLLYADQFVAIYQPFFSHLIHKYVFNYYFVWALIFFLIYTVVLSFMVDFGI